MQNESVYCMCMHYITLCNTVFFNRGSVEPKASVSARQGFRRWTTKNKNKAEINNKVN